MLASLLVVAASQGGTPAFPMKTALDGRPLLQIVANPSYRNAVALSDDGRMVFDLPGQRRAALPEGRWQTGELVLMGRDPSGKAVASQFVTASQVSHLPLLREIVGVFALASPRPDRLLVASGASLGLIRFEVRGPDPNPTMVLPGAFETSEEIAPDAFLVRLWLFKVKSRHAVVWCRVGTVGDRLTVRNVAAPAWSAASPPPPPPGLAAEDVLMDREGGTTHWVAGRGGKSPTSYDWSSATRRWQRFDRPVDDRDAGGWPLPARLYRSVGRLFAVPCPTSASPGTYEASADRKSWRRVSDREIAVVSASRRLCLTVNARTGETWVERFPDFAGEG